MSTFQQGSVLPQVGSLLEVISRLAPINAVVNDSVKGELPINVCFEDHEALRPFMDVLRRFRGNFRWIPLAQLPYVCVVPVGAERETALSAAQKKILAVQDIASLAKFVERELHLADSLSQGVIVRKIRKHTGEVGPGGPALLVADPRGYLANSLLPTSTRDRTVDYWISDKEGDLMYEKLHPSRRTTSIFRDMPLLARVCESKYEDLVISPVEVGALKEECQGMADSSADLKPAMERIARICDMAISDGLGIVVLGR